MTCSRLQERLESGRFVVTAEICPPKGSDCGPFLEKARTLGTQIDAINVTDNQGANMRISPLAAAALLIREGIEPILQLTCRDRNRLALQSELLGAAALGVHNVLALTGDHISFGDHRSGKPVFDLDSIHLLQVIERLNRGTDMSGAPLAGIPSFYAGAAAAPQAEPLAPTLVKLHKKVAAGARFLQTQAVFDVERFTLFSENVRPLGMKLIAGIFLLKSAAMARFVNRNIPGLRIPDELVDELERSTNPQKTGLDIACRMAAAIRPSCDGIHIMAMGREDLIPDIIKEIEP
jgi:5,10-methylenetetrahydrofolate reductase